MTFFNIDSLNRMNNFERTLRITWGQNDDPTSPNDFLFETLEADIIDLYAHTYSLYSNFVLKCPYNVLGYYWTHFLSTGSSEDNYYMWQEVNRTNQWN